MEKKNEILELSFEFAVNIIEFSELLEVHKKFIVSRQLLRSGTSIGANVRESQNCESKTDFVHKLKIAAKEAEETEYWLLLCERSRNYPYDSSLMVKLISIKKLLSSIISAMKNNAIKTIL